MNYTGGILFGRIVWNLSLHLMNKPFSKLP
jgi:hypothetical protein